MKIVGVIAEYNPFHNGHLYHLQMAKELTGADAAVVVMSGNYVQRGAPAVMPKHIRCEMALNAGAAAVIELPVCYATGSAEYFAAGAISLLDRLGCIDSICFGSECADLPTLQKIADIVSEEPEGYRKKLQEELKKGLSFPHARQAALLDRLNGELPEDLLKQPNNILGIEYLKALRQKKSPIRAYTIQRKFSAYHEENLTGTYSSASAIRKLLCSAGLQKGGETQRSDSFRAAGGLKDALPPSACALLEENYLTRFPITSDDFSLLLKYRLMTQTAKSLEKYMDITKELANRMIQHQNDLITFDQFCNLIKTRGFTYSRISRALIHLLLSIRRDDLNEYEKCGGCQYARILGFRRDSSDVLRRLKECSGIPILTKASRDNSISAAGKRMLETDVFASNIYESVVTEKFRTPFIHDYRHPVVVV